MSKPVLNCLLVATVAGFLGLSALVLYFLGPSSLFRRPDDLRLGLVVDRGVEAAVRMELAVTAALEVWRDCITFGSLRQFFMGLDA